MDPLSIIMSLLQFGQSANAPYNAAQAQTYATKEFYNNYPEYQSVSNVVNTPMYGAYTTKDKNTGNIQYNSPILGNLDQEQANLLSGGKYAAQKMAQQNANASLELKQDKKPGIVGGLSGILGIGGM